MFNLSDGMPTPHSTDMDFDLPGYDVLAGGRGLGIDLEERDYGLDRYGSLGGGSWGGGSGSGGLYDEEIPLGDDGLLDLYVPLSYFSSSQ